MSDAAEKRLTPDAKERLAAELRRKLSRERLRRLPFVVVGAILVAAAIGGIWYGLSSVTGLPPVMLIGYDALESDGVVRAQLVAPGDPKAKLEGLDIVWKAIEPNATEATTKTDATGTATFRIGPIRGASSPTIRASFLEDPSGYNRRDKTITPTADGAFGDPILLIALDDVVIEGKPVDWSERDRAKFPKLLTRAALGIQNCKTKGSPCAVIFASGDVGWEQYQRMRDWLAFHSGDADVAKGPLLNERADAIEARLSARMGPGKLRRWKPAAK